MPTIMAGLTQCIMLSLSMVVIAAMVGADGLGIPVLRAINHGERREGLRGGLGDRHRCHPDGPYLQTAGLGPRTANRGGGEIVMDVQTAVEFENVDDRLFGNGG